MVNAAVGARSVLGRSIESYNPGVRGGPIQYDNFDSVSLARLSPLNPSTAITGSAGMDRGTPGGMTFDNKLRYDLTVERFLLDIASQVGAPVEIAALGASSTAPYRSKFRPVSGAKTRALTLYLFEGGGYGAAYQVGRRADTITLTQQANKRIQTDIEYAPPVGDSICGLEIPATANTGTYTGKISTRGRRPYDSSYDNGDSLWLKVISSDAGSVTLKATMGAAALDGTVPSLTFGTHTFTVNLPPGEDQVAFTVVLDSTSGAPIGIFGENFEPLEIQFGNVFSDLSVLAANDIFEIPWQQETLTKVTTAQNRLSDYHLVRSLDGASQFFDSGTVKLRRPYAPYFRNRSKYSNSVDATGDLEATVSFKKRLFDRYFRRQMDENQIFSCIDVFQFEDVVVPADITAHEGIVIYYPQMAVRDMKSGDIANKNVQEETITLQAEQPTPAVPISDFGGFPGASAFEINVISNTNPATLGIAVG